MQYQGMQEDILLLNEAIQSIYQGTISQNEVFGLCQWGMERFETLNQEELFLSLYKSLIEAAEAFEQNDSNLKTCQTILSKNGLPELSRFIQDLLNSSEIWIYLTDQAEKMNLPLQTHKTRIFRFQESQGWNDVSGSCVLKAIITAQGESVPSRITNNAHLLLDANSLLRLLSEYYPLDDLIYARLYLQAKLELLRESRDIKIAVIGSSAARSNIVERHLPQKAVNLGITSLDVYYTVAIGLKALELCPSIQTVIWPVAYVGFPSDLTAAPNPVQRAVLSKIIRPVLHDLHGYSGPLPPETNAREIPPLYRHLFSPSLENYLYGSIIRQLKPLPYYNTQLFKRPPNGDMPFCFREKSVKENLYAADLLTQMQMKLIHPENNKQYRESVEQFAEFLKAKRIQFIGVVPPATPFYRDTLPQSLKTEFYGNLRDIFLSRGFPLLDFFDSPEFDDTDYVDYAHLNDQGAKKLTKLVSKYLTT